jgi:sigma-54 dependent transcriptional regulator, acetoin dehydrogenase operon transcriptional activator AcoR
MPAVKAASESASAGHARFIEAAVAGRGDTVAPDLRIRESWRRCLSSYHLAPNARQTPTIVSRSDLRLRRERSDPFYSIARIEMASLAQLLNAPVGVMLTDDQGVILGYAGASEFAEVAQRSGLREGALWSEAAQGTNGMGTCLATRQAVLIEASEHFLYQNAALTCCGAPILSARGELVGAINISGRLRLSPAPTLALIRMAVQNIENRALLVQHQRHHILRFHPHREFISTAGEGILAIDASGEIVGANLSALAWMGLSQHDELCGRSVKQVFGVDMHMLEALGRGVASASPLPQTERGSLCFGIIQPPQTAQRPSPIGRVTRLPTAKVDANALKAAERAALREVMDRCRWNVTLAAAQLEMNRRTLHRKLKAHGLHRYATWDATTGA